MEVTNKWTDPFPVPAGKGVIIRLSKQYVWIGVKITGKCNECWEQTFFGMDEEILIPVEVLNAICNPVISVKTCEDETTQVEFLLKDVDDPHSNLEEKPTTK